MKTLTDSEGNQYELYSPPVPGAQQDIVHGYYVLKPIAPIEAEQKVYYDFSLFSPEAGHTPFHELIEFTKPQAEAVAAAITALLEYVNDPTDDSGGEVLKTYAATCVSATKARQLIQGDTHE